MEIVHVYQKKRSDFGRQCKFSDRHAKLIVDIDPQPSAMEDYIYRNPADAAIQCASEFSEHEVCIGGMRCKMCIDSSSG